MTPSPVYKQRGLLSSRNISVARYRFVPLRFADSTVALLANCKLAYVLLKVATVLAPYSLPASPLFHSGLVVYGVANLFLNMACGVLCIFIGADSNLDTALAATVFGSHIQNLLSIGEG